MDTNRFNPILIVFVLLFLVGCASFRSDLEGEYVGENGKNYNAQKVDVLFIISHYKQAKGYDAIPKLENRRQIINDFDDLLIDACSEFSNIDRYTTFTNYAEDVSKIERRALKDSLISSHDYIIRMKFRRDASFPKYFFGSLASSLTLTFFPIAFKRQYSLEVNVYNHDGVLISSYSRSESLTKWVQSLLLFIYPFHTEKRKEEEIYNKLMHDIFWKIEIEKVLR